MTDSGDQIGWLIAAHRDKWEISRDGDLWKARRRDTGAGGERGFTGLEVTDLTAGGLDAALTLLASRMAPDCELDLCRDEHPRWLITREGGQIVAREKAGPRRETAATPAVMRAHLHNVRFGS